MLGQSPPNYLGSLEVVTVEIPFFGVVVHFDYI